MAYDRAKGMAASGKTVNRLNAKQLYQLCNWLEDLQPTFDHTTTKATLAIKATEFFGFNVVAANVDTAFDMAELSIPKAPIGESQKLAILKRAIEYLYSSVAEPLPPEWSDL